MKHSKSQVDGSPSQRPKLSSHPQPYVDVNDLRLMLKLGLGLHTIGEPRTRLEKACNGLARLAAADTWVAATLTLTTGGPAALSMLLTGGSDAEAAQSAAKEIESECSQSDTLIGKLMAMPHHTPGRVLAVIDDRKTAMHTVLHPEQTGAGSARLTWISTYRRVNASPFVERERRIVELFHSQTAWLLLQMA